jgi:hypothetical protein
MNLQVIAGDISSAYLCAETIENIYTVLGPEFGEWAGLKVIIIKASYGLKLSSHMWWSKLADSMIAMGFRPSKADYNIWMRKQDSHYEYVAVVVDDLLIFSENPQGIIGPLLDVSKYEMKGVGTPEYFSGGDVRQNPETGLWELRAKTYCENTVTRLEKFFDRVFKSYGSPMEKDDHPELDSSPILSGDEIRKYQMLIGCAQWAVTLGRFDIQYATNTLARYAAAPRAGHFERAIRIFGYLKSHCGDVIRLEMDPSDPDWSQFETVDFDWGELYNEAEEYIDPNTPEALVPELKHTVIMDASHANCLLTRRSTACYIQVLGQAIITTYSKRIPTVEASTYGAELVAARLAIERMIGLRYTLRMLGVKVESPALLLCDNASVVCNLQLPSSSLKKKHHGCAYHRCREIISLHICAIAHIKSEFNLADIGTKPLGPHQHYSLLKACLYGRE